MGVGLREYEKAYSEFALFQDKRRPQSGEVRSGTVRLEKNSGPLLKKGKREEAKSNHVSIIKRKL